MNEWNPNVQSDREINFQRQAQGEHITGLNSRQCVPFCPCNDLRFHCLLVEIAFLEEAMLWENMSENRHLRHPLPNCALSRNPSGQQ